jgi:hypothetical protein
MLRALADAGYISTADFVSFASERMVAALFVAKSGCYDGIQGIDAWDVERDARLYAGPYPVVAHPPCERWGRYWGGAPTTWPRLIKGDDGGCFAAALAAVRRWGGVLEHPEASAAWDAFRLAKPPRSGGWLRADWIDGFDGWTCCVEQGAYGHPARKATWLYACHVDLPELAWGRAAGDFFRLDDGYHNAAERARAIKTGICQRLSKRQRAATPIPFRDLLISIARTSRVHQSGSAAHPETRALPCASFSAAAATRPADAPNERGWPFSICGND